MQGKDFPEDDEDEDDFEYDMNDDDVVGEGEAAHPATRCACSHHHPISSHHGLAQRPSPEV